MAYINSLFHFIIFLSILSAEFTKYSAILCLSLRATGWIKGFLFREVLLPFLYEYKGVNLEALEEVPKVRIKYGIEKEGYRDMCGWNKDGAIFNFAMSFPSADMREYNNIKERIPALMEELENTAKSFIENLK